jgi:hypothetical protein
MRPFSPHTNDTQPPALAPAAWLAALAKSEAQLAAGEIVSGEEVMRELDECIVRLEAEPHRRAAPRR